MRGTVETLHVKMNEVLSPAGLASQVLLSLCEGQNTRVQVAGYLWVNFVLMNVLCFYR